MPVVEEVFEPPSTNTAPYFFSGLQDEYVYSVETASTAGSAIFEPLVLGDWYDDQQDAIDFSFSCLNCVDDQIPFTFNSTDNSLVISPSIGTGSYSLEFVLKDDHATEPAEKKYTFTVKIEEKSEEKTQEQQSLPDELKDQIMASYSADSVAQSIQTGSFDPRELPTF